MSLITLLLQIFERRPATSPMFTSEFWAAIIGVVLGGIISVLTNTFFEWRKDNITRKNSLYQWVANISYIMSRSNNIYQTADGIKTTFSGRKNIAEMTPVMLSTLERVSFRESDLSVFMNKAGMDIYYKIYSAIHGFALLVDMVDTYNSEVSALKSKYKTKLDATSPSGLSFDVPKDLEDDFKARKNDVRLLSDNIHSHCIKVMLSSRICYSMLTTYCSNHVGIDVFPNTDPIDATLDKIKRKN